MGDRTYAYYKVHPEDILAACELGLCNIDPSEDYTNFGGEVAPDSGLRHVDEVNYGGGMDWEDMAEAGIRFYGWHGAGGEYGASDFYSTGSGLYDYDTGENGGYVVYPNTNGEIDAEEIRALKTFVRNMWATKKLIDEAWSLLWHRRNVRRAEQC